MHLKTFAVITLKEKKHLPSVLVSNGYPVSFLQKITKTRKRNTSTEPTTEFKTTAVLPYVGGLSEQLRRCLQQQGVRAAFKSETTLRSHLVRPKDPVHPTKQSHSTLTPVSFFLRTQFHVPPTMFLSPVQNSFH